MNDRLRSAVAGFPRFEPGHEPLAIFGQPFHIVPLNDGARFRVWAELLAQSGAAQAVTAM